MKTPIIRLIVASVCLALISVGELQAAPPTTWYVATTGSDSPGRGTVGNPFRTIQYAIDAARNGDTVLVLEGKYTGPGNMNLNFKGKAITVQSRDPNDDDCVSATIIDAEGRGVIVRFVNDEGPGSIFAGFSLGAGDTSRAVRGVAGFFEFSDHSRPSTGQLRILGLVPLLPKKPIVTPLLGPPYGKLFWDGNDPFHQPVPTTDSYGSGDADGDGTLTSQDIALAQAMASGQIASNIRADVDGNGVVDSKDVSSINSALSGGILPGWWNRLPGRTERNDWVTKVMAIDPTNKHPYKYPNSPSWWICHDFATQLAMHTAFYRGDLFGTQYDGGQTVFDVPMYYVTVSSQNFNHGINAILVGDNPLNFDDWRFIEPQSDDNVIPGNWDMPFNSTISIQTFYVYGFDPYGAKVIFYIDDNGGKTLQSFDPNLLLTRIPPKSDPPDNRPDLWNPILAPQGLLLFDRLRMDMTRINDIHLSDLTTFVDPPTGTPLTLSPQFSRLLDITQAPDGTYHLLWYGKPESANYEPGVYHGILDPNTRTIVNATRVSTGTHLVNMARVVVTSRGEIHVFWYDHYGFSWSGMPEFGLYWARWTGSRWQAEQNLTPGLYAHDRVPNWTNRQLYRYFFDVAAMGDNSVVLIWRDNRINNIFSYQVSQLVFDSDKGVWNASVVPTESPEQVRGVDLIRATDGVLHLAYWLGAEQDDTVEGRGTLVHRMWAGTSWSAPVTLDISGNACCPRLSPGTNGDIYLVWERKEAGQVVPVWAKYVSGMWGTAQQLSVSTGADAWYPTVEFLPNGNNLVVAWSSRSGDRVTIETQQIPQPAPSHITVTSSTDSGPGSLRWAIASVAPGGVIDFALNTPVTINLTTQLVIGKSMTIQGPGAGLLTISGNNRTRVFEIANGASVTIQALGITNGLADGLDEPIGGGAIRNQGTLTLDNTILTGNQANYGGGIRNQGTMTITNNIIASNKTVGVGGRPAGDGGAIFNIGKLTIRDSGIGSGNQAQGGGGILNWGTGTANLTNVTMDSNLANLSGGAIENGDHGTVSITDSQIVNNQALGTDPLHGGGAIRNFGGTITLKNTKVANNSAQRGGGIYNNIQPPAQIASLVIDGSTVSTNNAIEAGGGIRMLGGNLTITNSTFSSNIVTGTYGGAGIYNQGATVAVNHCTFASNTAPASGRTILNPSGTVNLKNTIIFNNSSGNCSGAVADGGYNLRWPATDSSCVGSFGDPKLGPLQNNGGTTLTIALLPGSAAIDKIPIANCNVATDQRGWRRPIGPACDIGAFEAISPVFLPMILK